MDLTMIRRASWRVSAGLMLSAAFAVPASAQTIQLTESNATVIRGGTYANTNFSKDLILVTRASSDATYERRALLKFDTQNTIPANSQISSAKLTMTVAGGNGETRQISAYRISQSYEEVESTWKVRKSATAWSSAGGDYAEKWASASATASAGSHVIFDVTSLVQNAVNGKFGSSRYTRIALRDSGAASQDSYKEYYSDDAADASVRPVLTVTYGVPATTTPTPTPPATSTSGTKLRVLQWNIPHGVSSNGIYSIDRQATWIAKMNPDVVTLNEVEKNTGWGNEDQPARFKSLLESKTGRTWYYHFAQEFGDWSSSGKGHLILSRYPFESTGHTTITASSGLNGAGAVSEARIIVNGRTINLIVGHLDPESSTMRLIQAKEVLNWGSSFAQNRILSGDMNAWPDQSSIAEYDKTYKDSWTVATSKGTAYEYSGLSPDGATKKGRIDYIFYSSAASDLSVVSSQVYDTRDSAGHMPSDHRPVLTVFNVN
jgi:endonuclease/exonuclease/phosphatase family metal-dependent hydrolase